MRVVLCGLPKSGKSTIARAASERLGWEWDDSDRLIEAVYRARVGDALTCREICKKEGEPFFRELESELLCSLSPGTTPHLLALGGGSLEMPKTVQNLHYDRMIYLHLPFKEAWKRLSSGELPAFLSKDSLEASFYRLAEKRHARFLTVAHQILETDGLSIPEVTGCVVRDVQQYIRKTF
ncbi:MAG: shikimate kinase [Chlamydiia bacterium]|nr:shikimate kinase [Chlamydiia bacterium]